MKKDLKKTEIDVKAENIQKLCFDKMYELLILKAGSMDNDDLNNELRKINIANHLINNYQVMTRISQGQQIRVFNMITCDKPELKRYIEISMPHVLPSELE